MDTLPQIHYPEFRNRVAVVSGAAQGIGQSIVHAMQQMGMRVAQLDCQFSGATEYQYAVDVTDENAVMRTIDDIENQLGEVDYLVSCAGILRLGPLLDMSSSDWHDTFAVNASGTFNLVRAVGKKMRSRKRGVMVAVGSNAASVPRMGMGCYAASKAAMTQMMKCLGLELAAYNIRCNVVAPGSTSTEMQRQLWVDSSGPKKVIQGDLSQYRLGIPLQRIASPEQVSQLVLFLLSDHAQHITLESIVIDGGATLGC